MNREEVIRLAREAGFDVQYLFGTDEVCVPDYNYWTKNPDIGQDVITHIVERFTNLVAAAEREACIEVLLSNFDIEDEDVFNVADAIRARDHVKESTKPLTRSDNVLNKDGIRWEVEP